jgi:hypothetical protein
MSVDREELKQMIDQIPEQDAIEVYDFIGYLNRKRDLNIYAVRSRNLSMNKTYSIYCRKRRWMNSAVFSPSVFGHKHKRENVYWKRKGFSPV